MPMKRAWAVIGGATAAAAIGAGGLVLTGASDDGDLPGPISLQDGSPVAAEDAPDQSKDEFQVVPNPVHSADSPDDSPASAPPATSVDSPDDSPASAPPATSVDSPDDSPDTSPDGSVDSPDSSA